MIEVNIENYKTGRKYQSRFETLELANEWIDSCKSKNSWGLPERTIELTECINIPVDEIIEQFNEVYGEVEIPMCRIKCEYTIEVSEVVEDIQAKVKTQILNAIIFGQDLVAKFAAENVIMGITQDGKTKEVRVVFADVLNALQTGSLYDAIAEVKAITDRDQKYLTDARIISFANHIEDYLGIARTTQL